MIEITAVPACYRLTRPVPAWRLALRNGRPILQASRIWTDGDAAGIEWSDALPSPHHPARPERPG